MRAAREAARRAYAPYSRLRVGAALLTASGRVVTAANVECARYGLTLCAERAAVARALAEGERRFRALAVAVAGGRPITPCGACRQVLAEFAPELVVVVAGPGGRLRRHRLGRLLPKAFALSGR
jgi:cytidine deaminase